MFKTSRQHFFTAFYAFLLAQRTGRLERRPRLSTGTPHSFGGCCLARAKFDQMHPPLAHGLSGDIVPFAPIAPHLHVVSAPHGEMRQRLCFVLPLSGIRAIIVQFRHRRRLSANRVVAGAQLSNTTVMSYSPLTCLPASAAGTHRHSSTGMSAQAALTMSLKAWQVLCLM